MPTFLPQVRNGRVSFLTSSKFRVQLSKPNTETQDLTSEPIEAIFKSVRLYLELFYLVTEPGGKAELGMSHTYEDNGPCFLGT